MLNGSTKPNATGGDVPACLCKQVMRREPERPSLRYSSARREYIMFCPSCGMRTYPSMNRQSVIAEWCGINRPGDQHIEQLWLEKFDHQQNQPQHARAAPEAGTTVPT